ncbi:MlaA family lipoprotein [Thermomonas carbonis]|uniref:VacJ family lipoprotein n=1 Tax=Thermomonas carbonis TaxID=1463158 RepID=A0A7G9SUM3_9GAMM|nr:VacJ family lipoprotein [Thermomonas carbonis]
MMRLRSLVLLLSCALASACATTGDRAAETAAPQDAPAIAGDVAAADTSTPSVATDVEPPVPATPVLADTTQPQDTTGHVADATPGDAEADFAAIYGQPGDRNGLAMGGDPAPAAFDPWEKYNRRVHAFNMAVDRGLAKPLARAYVAAVPRPLRIGVNNFFDNLGQPVTVVNSLLQGNPRGAGNALGRFLLNSTVGIGGLFDVATKAKMPKRGEDFGQTLAVWGWQRSRYLELPMLGPRTVRDMIGLVGDARLRPVQYVEDDKTRVFLQGLQLVDLRAKLLPIEGLMNQGAVDEYALFRDMWLQRRNYQINQNGRTQDAPAADEAVPPYLMEDGETVPPATPGG